jgi:hypothetical protein
MSNTLRKFIIEAAAGARITSVGAHNVDEARARARDVLDRPGRTHLLRHWQDDGEPVRDEASGQVYTLKQEPNP